KPTDRTPLAYEVLIYGIFAFIFFSFLLTNFFRPRASARLAVATRGAPVSQQSPPLATESQQEPLQAQAQAAHFALAPSVGQERSSQAAVELLHETTHGESGEVQDDLDIKIEDLERIEPAVAPQETEQPEPEPFSTSGLGWRD